MLEVLFMRIDITSFYGVKQNKTNNKPFENKGLGNNKTIREDKIEFSSKPDEKDYSLSNAKKSVLASLEKETDPCRLDEIKSQILSGKYDVPSSKIASSIIGEKI